MLTKLKSKACINERKGISPMNKRNLSSRSTVKKMAGVTIVSMALLISPRVVYGSTATAGIQKVIYTEYQRQTRSLTAGINAQMERILEEQIYALKLSTEKSIVDKVGVVEEPKVEEAKQEVVEETEEPAPEFEDSYELENVGYISSEVGLNVRTYPSMDEPSEVVGVLPFAEEVYYTSLESPHAGWVVIEYEGEYRFIAEKFINDEKPMPVSSSVVMNASYSDYSVPSDNRKSYMGWKSITNRSSLQYKLQQAAYTGDYGVREVNGRYCIAIGSYYGASIGQYIDVILEDGTILPCIKGDAKKNSDTINGNAVGADGGAVEFIVSTDSIPRAARQQGSMTEGTGWGSKVVTIRVYNANYFD